MRATAILVTSLLGAALLTGCGQADEPDRSLACPVASDAPLALAIPAFSHGDGSHGAKTPVSIGEVVSSRSCP